MKRLQLLVLCGMMILLLAACQRKNGNTEQEIPKEEVTYEKIYLEQTVRNDADWAKAFVTEVLQIAIEGEMTCEVQQGGEDLYTMQDEKGKVHKLLIEEESVLYYREDEVDFYSDFEDISPEDIAKGFEERFLECRLTRFGEQEEKDGAIAYQYAMLQNECPIYEKGFIYYDGTTTNYTEGYSVTVVVDDLGISKVEIKCPYQFTSETAEVIYEDTSDEKYLPYLKQKYEDETAKILSKEVIYVPVVEKERFVLIPCYRLEVKLAENTVYTVMNPETCFIY